MGVFNVRDLEVMQMGLQNELNELEENYANGKVDEKYYRNRKEWLIGHIRNLGAEIAMRMFENDTNFDDFNDFLK